jgi:SAM-dependent methyltransferase
LSISTLAHQEVHNKLVSSRRIHTLTSSLDSVVPRSADILDVGCGNGIISHNLRQLSPERVFTGIDVLARKSCLIPCQIYDGDTIPFAPQSFDYVMFVDVLHHMMEPSKFLAQAVQIARRGIIIKDHYSENSFDHQTLTLMDWFGNAQYGVALPNNYKSRAQWRQMFSEVQLREDVVKTEIPLYPFPANLLFGRNLHFIGRYNKLAAQR